MSTDTNDVELPEMCVFIMETVKTEKGEFIPCIAKRGETGYYKTDWAWGTVLADAKRIADEYNERLGISQKQAVMLQISTMRMSK